VCVSQLNPLVNFGLITEYSILLVSEFIIETLDCGTKICILLGCEAACPNPGYMIGAPVDIRELK
jgi:hypothetical protein